METGLEVKQTLNESGFLDDFPKTRKMDSPNGRPMHKSEDEVPFGPEINFHRSESTPMDVHESLSGETAHRRKLWSIIFRSIRLVVFSNRLNLLMPFGPLAIIVQKLTGHHGWVFALSLLGIMPLAERLGYATEQLAFFTGDTVGGLLNATFGNATELIISIYALKNGMIRVVQLSLLGSILSNMLLVLGCAFLGGGIVFHKKEQVFNKAAASVNSGLLLMALMGLIFPAVLQYTHTEVHLGKSELSLSRFSSCVMLVAYAAYLYFQLKSQRDLYVSVDEKIPNMFTMKYGFGLSNPIFLKPPDGTKWKVYWKKQNNGEVWLEIGWKEFTQNYSLKYGCLVMFKYEGEETSSQFDVIILNQNGVEYCDNDTFDDESDDDEPVQVFDECPYQNNRQKPVLVSPRPHKKNRGEVKIEIEIENENEKTSKRNSSLNSPRGAKAQEVAQNFISCNPFFTVVIKPFHMVKSQMYVPNLEGVVEMTAGEKYVMLQKGTRSWSVKLLRCKSTNGCRLSAGWPLFITESGILPDDVCVFELINTKDSVFKVHVF